MQVATGPWYEVHSVEPGLSRILETHVAPWMRCNMWLIHGRDGKNRGRGKDWTAGCIAVKDKEIEVIYSMIREGTPIFIYP